MLFSIIPSPFFCLSLFSHYRCYKPPPPLSLNHIFMYPNSSFQYISIDSCIYCSIFISKQKKKKISLCTSCHIYIFCRPKPYYLLVIFGPSRFSVYICNCNSWIIFQKQIISFLLYYFYPPLNTHTQPFISHFNWISTPAQSYNLFVFFHSINCLSNPKLNYSTN